MSESATAVVAREVGDAMSAVARDFDASVRERQEGQVVRVADGVIQIHGLPGASSEEVVNVGDAGRALVLAIDKDGVRAVALDHAATLRIGDAVRTTGQGPTVPAGPPMLGRVVDPLGNPLDGVPLRGALTPMPLEREAPAVYERSAVHQPLSTGTLAIDAMFPIGRGQRELIVGEDGSGKTSLALDAILRQRDTDVVCVYVAVGRRRSDTWRVVETLRERGGRWVVVATADDDPPAMRYLAPFAGTAIAEYFMRRGEHALIVYDDLTAQAVAWRELSLLLRRPPGREAYPGDIFYLHSRLLERAAQLSPDHGGGSLTALPLAVLEGGRLTAYIPTNLISITDGQIVLSRTLFAAGHRPAIDAGLSVSRVGAKAQPVAFRELAGRLRLEYAAFLELEAFSRLGTRLEASTARRIDVGQRIRALFHGRRLAPLSMFDEVVRLVMASEHDALLELPLDRVESVANGMSRAGRSELGDLPMRIERDATFGQDDAKALRSLFHRLVGSKRTNDPEAVASSTLKAAPKRKKRQKKSRPK